MSIQSKFQLSRASESKMVIKKPFSIVVAQHLTERLKQLCAGNSGKKDALEGRKGKGVVMWDG